MTGNSGSGVNSVRLYMILLAAALVCACFLMTLPLYHFTASVYTKKSSNTFVGDEKYQAARAEAEEVAAEYAAKGMEAEIVETVTERTNSKGEKTSLIAFSIEQTIDKNLWSFLRGGLPSGIVLAGMAVCMLLALLCAAAGCAGTSGMEQRTLPLRARLLRGAACLFLLADLVMVPVFVLMNNVLFWRKISLYRDELETVGKDEFYASVDRFLFDGQMGDGIGSALKNFRADHDTLVWLLVLIFLAAILAAVQIRFGRVKNSVLKGILYAFVIVVCAITLFPYYVMFITAFRSNAETLDMYFLHLLPTKWVWSNLKDIVGRGVPRYLINSGIVAGGSTLLAMLCGIPAAYAMARMEFRGRKAFLGFVIMSQMFSPVVLLIGISQLMNTIHLNDTILGLVFVNAAFNQAFAVWLLRGTFVAISPDMEQAAKIDGCSTIGALIRVLLPMAAPGIVTTLIFVFINAWNEYTISTVLISTASNRPITVGITQFSSFNMIEWQYLFAASLLATIPVVILFMAIEKHLTSGLTSGGVKG